MALIPNSEKFDEQGNVTHFGIIDPITGEPSLIPHVGGNYAMFGGGSGAQELQASAAGGGGAGYQGGFDAGRVGELIHAIPSGISDAFAGQAAQMSGAPAAPAVAAPASLDPASAVPVINPGADVGPARTPAPANSPSSGSGGPMFTGPGGATMTPALGAQMKTTQDTTSGISVDPAQMSKFEEATKRQGDALDAQAAAQVAESKVRQAQAEAEHAAIVEQQQRQAEARAQYEAALAKKQKEISDSTDKFLNKPIDANHFWADKGTGDKVMAGIAIALGALGGALQGTNGNVGLDVINKAIDRDLKAQEMEMQKQGTAIGLKRGLLSDYVQQFGDTERAKEAAFIAYQKGVAQHFEAQAQAAKDPGTIAIAQKAKAMLDADTSAKIMELTKKTTSHQETVAPMAQGTTLGTKEQDELSELERVHNRLGTIIEKVDSHKDKFGKIANASSTINEFLGLPTEATKLQVDTALQQVLTDGLVAKRRGVYTPETAKEVDALQKQIGTNPETMVSVLKGIRADTGNIVDSRRRAYSSTGSILPVDQRTKTTSEMNAELKKKK